MDDDLYANVSDEEEYTYEEDDEYYDDGNAAGEDILPNDSGSDAKAGGAFSENARNRNGGVGSHENPDDVPMNVLIPNDNYKIKLSSEIAPVVDALVAEVASLLDLSADETERVLLLHRWDKEKLIESYFSDPEKNMKDAGLNLYSASMFESISSASMGAKTTTSSGQLYKCRICYDDQVPKETGFSLGCGHTFCKECFAQYLAAQVGDGPQCVLAKCPEHKCTQTITRRVYQAFLQGEDLKKYDVYRVKDFISTSKNMKYCPAPRCDKVALGSGVTTVRCTCSNPFCFKCGEEAHEPCSCAQLAEWNEKCANESETANWILANTRKCPKCHTRIEKNQGCNHMVCRMCKHEFCWICMGEWKEHGQSTGGYYKCNRFEAGATDPSGAAATPEAKAKAELDRYLHYYQRYHGHSHALKFASGQRELAERRMVEHQAMQKSSWIDVQFMKQAAEQVIECRRVLKYTYVLGYFLPDGTAEKQLFEHHQEMLEKNTELLHEYTEMPLERMDRTQVINLTRVTEKFMSGLLGKMSGGVVLQEDFAALGSGGGGAATSAVAGKSGGGSCSDAKGVPRRLRSAGSARASAIVDDDGSK